MSLLKRLGKRLKKGFDGKNELIFYIEILINDFCYDVL